MAKNWQNSGFVAKFLTKCALFDEQKMAFWRQNHLEPIYNLRRRRTLCDKVCPSVCLSSVLLKQLWTDVVEISGVEVFGVAQGGTCRMVYGDPDSFFCILDNSPGLRDSGRKLTLCSVSLQIMNGFCWHLTEGWDHQSCRLWLRCIQDPGPGISDEFMDDMNGY